MEQVARQEKKVLIADDHETVLMALEHSIRLAGYVVLKASDGEEAYRLATAEYPDIIVSDITMPEMDGIELCRKIRGIERLAEVPFIFLTAHGDPAERVQGLRCGADDYIVKPFDLDELVARIDILYEKIQKRKFSVFFSGDLKELPLADTLQILAQAGKEGVVHIRDGASSGFVAVKDGHVMDVSLANLNGEDALVELLQLRSGNFHYEPREIKAGDVNRPVVSVVLEAVRLIDELAELHAVVPDLSTRFKILEPAASDDPELQAILAALGAGCDTGDELCARAGLSRIRMKLALAKLLRGGQIATTAGVAPAPVREPHSQARPLKILFVFSDEVAAARFLEQTAAVFQVPNSRGMKAGGADFLKIDTQGRHLQIFSLRGEKKFSFLWEPMLRTSDAAIFLLHTPADTSHVAFFREKLAQVKNLPFFPVSLEECETGGEVEHLADREMISGLFARVLNEVA